MITRVVDATVRHRRAVLIAGIALAGCQAAVAARAPGNVAVLAVFALLIILVGVAAGRRVRPAAFVVRTGTAAFTAPAAAWPLFSALCLLAFASDQLGSLARSVGLGDWIWLAAGLHVVAVLVAVTRAWLNHDIVLRPDGLYDRRGLGTVIVPWEAMPTPRPRRRKARTTTVFPPGAFAPQATEPDDTRMAEIRLDFARPYLVQRRGLARNADRIDPTGVDARFLVGAIDFYVRHPEQRAGIGTDGGYLLLQRALAPRTE